MVRASDGRSRNHAANLKDGTRWEQTKRVHKRKRPQLTGAAKLSNFSSFSLFLLPLACPGSMPAALSSTLPACPTRGTALVVLAMANMPRLSRPWAACLLTFQLPHTGQCLPDQAGCGRLRRCPHSCTPSCRPTCRCSSRRCICTRRCRCEWPCGQRQCMGRCLCRRQPWAWRLLRGRQARRQLQHAEQLQRRVRAQPQGPTAVGVEQHCPLQPLLAKLLSRPTRSLMAVRSVLRARRVAAMPTQICCQTLAKRDATARAGACQ